MRGKPKVVYPRTNKSLRFTLTEPDYKIFKAIATDLNIHSDPTLAKKFVLDGMRAYLKKNDLIEVDGDLYGREDLNAQEVVG